MVTGTIFDQLAGSARGDAAPPGSSSAASRSSLPGGGSDAPPNPAGNGGAPGPGATGTIFDRLAANPELGAAPQVRTPGSFGPYDESESHIFLGPLDKGVNEGFAKSYGLKSPNEGIGDVLKDSWENLVEGGKQTWEKLRTGHGTVSSGALFVPEMIAQGVEGSASLLEEGTGTLKTGLMKGDRQAIGQGIGMLIGALSQVAMGMEGADKAQSLASGLGKKMEERAPHPGNELVRANAERNYRFGKNPGRYLVDEPVRPTNSLENLLQQNEGHQARLHAAVQQTLRDADTITSVDGRGQVTRVPNLIDPVSEIHAAADEILNDLKEQGGVTNRKAIAQAIKDTRDDILQQHDADGNPTGPISDRQVPSQVNELKRSIGGRADYTVYSNADEATKAKYVDRFVKRTYGKLNELVDDAASGVPGERVRDLNRRYANAIEFEDLLRRRIAQESGTGGFVKLLRKGEWGSAITALLSGNAALHPVGAAVLANRMLRTTAGRILRAKALRDAGGALQTTAGRAIERAGAGAAAAAGMPSGESARRVLEGEQ